MTSVYGGSRSNGKRKTSESLSQRQEVDRQAQLVAEARELKAKGLSFVDNGQVREIVATDGRRLGVGLLWSKIACTL